MKGRTAPPTTSWTLAGPKSENKLFSWTSLPEHGFGDCVFGVLACSVPQCGGSPLFNPGGGSWLAGEIQEKMSREVPALAQ